MDTFQSKRIISSDKAPRAIGPYSIAIQTGSLIFTSGQLGILPDSGELAAGGIEAETQQVLTNLRHVLEAAGTDLSQVVKTTVYLSNMEDFKKMNAVYARFFENDPPARTTIAAAGLPKGAAIEIEAIALVPGSNQG